MPPIFRYKGIKNAVIVNLNVQDMLFYNRIMYEPKICKKNKINMGMAAFVLRKIMNSKLQILREGQLRILVYASLCHS